MNGNSESSRGALRTKVSSFVSYTDDTGYQHTDGYSDERQCDSKRTTKLALRTSSTSQATTLTHLESHSESGTSPKASSKRYASAVLRHIDMSSKDVESWPTLRVVLCWINQSSAYDCCMVAIIFANMAASVHATDLRARQEKSPFFMVTCPLVFCTVYVVDLGLRLYIFRRQFANDFLNLFDAAIVFVDLISLVFEGLFSDARFVSALRALRMLKIIRVIRRVRQFRELYLMLQGCAEALKPILFGAVLIFANLVVWSILAVELLHPRITDMVRDNELRDCSDCAYAFASVADALLTFVRTTLGGDWGTLAVPVIRKHTWAATIFIPALLTVEIGLLNIIAAVLVDRQAQARVKDDELYNQIRHEERMDTYKRLEAMFHSMDADGSGTLTEREFKVAYTENREFKFNMDLLDVTADDISMLFQIMDSDGSGEIFYEEFVKQLVYLETVNQRTLLVLMSHVVHQMKEIVLGHGVRLQGLEHNIECQSVTLGDHVSHVKKVMLRSAASDDLDRVQFQQPKSRETLGTSHIPKQQEEEEPNVLAAQQDDSLCGIEQLPGLKSHDLQSATGSSTAGKTQFIVRSSHASNTSDERVSQLSACLEAQFAALKERLVCSARTIFEESALSPSHAKWEALLVQARDAPPKSMDSLHSNHAKWEFFESPIPVQPQLPITIDERHAPSKCLRQ